MTKLQKVATLAESDQVAISRTKPKKIKEQEEPCPEGQVRNEEGECVPKKEATEQ